MITVNNIEEYIREVLNPTPVNRVAIYRGQTDISWNIEASVFRQSYSDGKEKDIFVDVSYDKPSLSEIEPYSNIILDSAQDRTNTYYFDTILGNQRIRVQQGCFSILIDKKMKLIEPLFIEFLEDCFRKYISSRILSNNLIELIAHDIGNDKLNDELLRVLQQSYVRHKSISVARTLFETYLDKIIKHYPSYLKKMNFMPNSSIITDEANNFHTFLNDVIKGLDNDSKILDKSSLVQIRIPAGEKQHMKIQLAKIGVDSTSVYPDLEGTIEFLKNKFS